jgi:DNA-directed RNA polymerase subunit H (RpoH/RPB5)
MKQADCSSTDTLNSAVKCDLAIEVLRSFGELRFAATGWSMLPTIWPEDTLVVERVGHDQVHMGDIVLVGRGAKLRAHRVISKTEASGTAYFVTQGDAMLAADQPVLKSELLGRVAHLIRAGEPVAVRTKVSVLEGLIARVVRHSFTAARVLVYLHRLAHTIEKSSPQKSRLKESVLPCQS